MREKKGAGEKKPNPHGDDLGKERGGGKKKDYYISIPSENTGKRAGNR